MTGETGRGAPENELDARVRIERDGTVTVFSGKVELGTGVRTALAQIVAEELDVPFDRVNLVMGDTRTSPDEGYTAGSKTIQVAGAALRQVGAEARAALVELASEQLDAAPEELVVEDGIVSVRERPERSVTYAALMGGKQFHRQLTGRAPVKDPARYRLVGKAVPRADIPLKVSGKASFVQDMRAPGMMHGRVVRPPSASAELLSIDESSVRELPGKVALVVRGNFVGVVAEREEEAVRAAKQLRIEWKQQPTLPPQSELFDVMRRLPAEDRVIFEQGETGRGFERVAVRAEALYAYPFQAHASMGPSCAVADVRADGATIWASTQGAWPLRGALAQLLELPREQVQVIYAEGAGCYGQNGSDDAAADAAVLSQATGKPVRVQWMREDEFAWEPKGAAVTVGLRGGLDARGQVIFWDSEIWSPTHAARPRAAQDLLAAQLMARTPPPPTKTFIGADRNARTNYAIPNQRIAGHWIPNPPLRTSSFRSLGAIPNTFANESFMDELAAAAGADAVEFRLRHLDDARAREVLMQAAGRAGWQTRPSPQREARDRTRDLYRGRGVGYAQYENREAYAAVIAEVRVERASGIVRVERIVVAHDCGLVINPDGLANQIEGSVIQATSRALKEEVKFDEYRVTSLDWASYPILTFREAPEVEIVLVNRTEQPSLGAGEPAGVPVAAAIANAIFDATGARLRQIPFLPGRVQAGLELK